MATARVSGSSSMGGQDFLNEAQAYAFLCHRPCSLGIPYFTLILRRTQSMSGIENSPEFIAAGFLFGGLTGRLLENKKVFSIVGSSSFEAACRFQRHFDGADAVGMRT